MCSVLVEISVALVEGFAALPVGRLAFAEDLAESLAPEFLAVEELRLEISEHVDLEHEVWHLDLLCVLAAVEQLDAYHLTEE